MDFEPWAGQYLHYPWSEGVSITATGQEPPVGFEPTTARLRIESSTTELRWRGPNLATCCAMRYSTVGPVAHLAEEPVDLAHHCRAAVAHLASHRVGTHGRALVHRRRKRLGNVRGNAWGMDRRKSLLPPLATDQRP